PLAINHPGIASGARRGVGTYRAAVLLCSRGRRRRRQDRDDFPFPFNQFLALAGTGIHPCPFRRDPPLPLLVAVPLNPRRTLDLHLQRHQKRADFSGTLQAASCALLDGLWSVALEISTEREQEILVQRSTRSLQ